MISNQILQKTLDGLHQISTMDFAIFDADEDGYLKEASSPKEGCTCWGDDFASEAKAKVLRYSSKAFSRGIYYVVPLILSYSVDPSKDNTVQISDFSVSF